MFVCRLFVCLLVFDIASTILSENRVKVYFVDTKINFERNVHLEGLEFTSPLFIGLVCGGALAVIFSVLMIWCCCRKSSDETPKPQTNNLKVEIVEKSDLSIDKNKIKISDKDESISDKIVDVRIEDSTRRDLVELKEQKISKLFENFVVKLNDKYHSEQDKQEFYKPSSDN